MRPVPQVDTCTSSLSGVSSTRMGGVHVAWLMQHCRLLTAMVHEILKASDTMLTTVLGLLHAGQWSRVVLAGVLVGLPEVTCQWLGGWIVISAALQRAFQIYHRIVRLVQ